MFLEIRKRGKHKRYYLVYKIRENGKSVKISRYIGQNLSEEELKKRQEKAEKYLLEQVRMYKEIRDPLKTVLSEQELRQIENLEKKIDFKVVHLNQERWQRFSELFSYNTNAIEGSTITLGEVKKVLEHKSVDKNPHDIEETKGVIEAIAFIRKTKVHFSLELLKKVHQIVFKKSKSFAGTFRKKGIEVVIRDGHGNIVHQGTPSHLVEKELQELVSWYGKNKKKYSGLLLAAVIHNQFENIHPFQDGNGRVGRILLNNILLKHDLPPVNIEFKNRAEYYHTLQAYEKTGNIRPTLDLIIKEYKKLKKKL